MHVEKDPQWVRHDVGFTLPLFRHPVVVLLAFCLPALSLRLSSFTHEVIHSCRWSQKDLRVLRQPRSVPVLWTHTHIPRQGSAWNTQEIGPQSIFKKGEKKHLWMKCTLTFFNDLLLCVSLLQSGKCIFYCNIYSTAELFYNEIKVNLLLVLKIFQKM